MTKVTEGIFSAIKTLIEAGATNVEIAKLFKISASTVSLIRNAETRQEYLNTVAAYKARVKAKEKAAKVEPPKEEKPQKIELPKEEKATGQCVIAMPTHWTMTELQKTNELLTSISNKLAFIVEQLS